MGKDIIGLNKNYGMSPSAIKSALEKRTAKDNKITGKRKFQSFDKNKNPFGKVVEAQSLKIAKMLTTVPRDGGIVEVSKDL